MDNISHFVFGKTVEITAGPGAIRSSLLLTRERRKGRRVLLTIQRRDGLRLIKGWCGTRSSNQPPSLAALLQCVADLSDLIVHRRQVIFDFVQLVEHTGHLSLTAFHHRLGVMNGTPPDVSRRRRRRTRHVVRRRRPTRRLIRFW